MQHYMYYLHCYKNQTPNMDLTKTLSYIRRRSVERGMRKSTNSLSCIIQSQQAISNSENQEITL